MLFLLPYTFQLIRPLQSLPPGATNGEWSARAVAEGHRALADTMEELIDTTGLIARGEIVGETKARIDLGSGYTYHLYTVHQFEILEVYKGDLLVGNILDIIQVYRLENKRTFPYNYPDGAAPIQYIREDLSLGDELILFLRTPWPPLMNGSIGRVGHTFTVRRIQGAYRYILQELRDNHVNRVFESVNPHNNLVLTEADLQQLRNLRDSAD